MLSKLRDLTTKKSLDEFYIENEDPWGTRSIPEKIVRYEEIERLLPSNRVNSALEISCGEGDFLVKIAKISKKVVASDISMVVLKRTAKKFNNIAFLNADIKTFSSEFFSHFDLLVWLDAMYFLSYQQSRHVLGEISESYRSKPFYIIFSARIVPLNGRNIDFWEDHDFSSSERYIGHIREFFPTARPVPVQLNFNIRYPSTLSLTQRAFRICFKVITRFGGYRTCLKLARLTINFKNTSYYHLIESFVVHLSMVVSPEIDNLNNKKEKFCKL